MKINWSEDRVKLQFVSYLVPRLMEDCDKIHQHHMRFQFGVWYTSFLFQCCGLFGCLLPPHPISIATEINTSFTSGTLFRKIKILNCSVYYSSISLPIAFLIDHKHQVFVNFLCSWLCTSHHFTISFINLASVIWLVLLLAVITSKHIVVYQSNRIQQSAYVLFPLR